VIAVFRPTRPGDADAVLRCVRMLKAVRAVIERRECGANADGGGGFQPGNTCGKGGGKGGSKKSGKVHDGTGLAMNDDGTVTVYHHTSAANADKIKATGKLKSAGEPHVYVTTEPGANTGYGDTVVPIKVNPDDLELDDEFPGGRKDFKISVGRPGGEVKVGLDQAVQKDAGGAPAGAASDTVKSWAKQKFSDPEHARAFTEWFGDSKVLGDNGEPLVVYHGTNANFDEFKPSAKGMLGPGIYASADKGDYGPYSPYAGKEEARVVPLYMTIKNPHYAIAGDVKTFDAPPGHDGTILIDRRTRKVLWAVTQSPAAVKSATGNRGTFDPKSPKITRAIRAGKQAATTRDCGTGAGGFKPGNKCAGGGGESDGGSAFPSTHPEAQARLKDHFGSLIDKAGSLVGIKNDGTDVREDHPFAAEARQNIEAASQFMTPSAMQRAVSNVEKVSLYNSPEELTSLAERGGRYIPDGYLIAGQYASETKELRVSRSSHAPGTVSHELMHAVDGPGFQLSSSSAWREAYEAEIKGGRLSKYASTSPKEGFAEFGRALITRQLPPRELKAEFPLSWKAMKELRVF
jgi:hypothetical protein